MLIFSPYSNPVDEGKKVGIPDNGERALICQGGYDLWILMQTNTRILPHVLSNMVFIIMTAGRGCIFHQCLQYECQNTCVSKKPSLGVVL